MNRKSFLTALLIGLAVLGAEAQTNKVYKADTVIDGNGNKIITVYSQGTFTEGNGNVVTRDFDVAAFDEIKTILPVTINYTVADDYSCRVTLDENLFEYLDIHTKGNDLVLGFDDRKVQHTNLTPTKFVIELSAPTIEKISITGSGNFCFVTPFETHKLKIQTAGSGSVIFKETANIHHFEMHIAGSGDMECKELNADHANLSVAGSGDMNIESGTVKNASFSVAGSGKLECKELNADHANLSVAGSGDLNIESGKVKSANISVAGTGSVETRCELESMDYNISGWGSIYYYGDVKVKGTNIGGKIGRIDSENVKTNKKCCDEKQKKTKNQANTF